MLSAVGRKSRKRRKQPDRFAAAKQHRHAAALCVGGSPALLRPPENRHISDSYLIDFHI